MGKINPVVSKQGDQIAVSQWFWASKVPSYTAPQTVKEDSKDDGLKSLEAQDELNQILANNSSMSASTFLNLLKTKGYQVTKIDGVKTEPAEKPEEKAPEQNEADAASSNTQALRTNLKMKQSKALEIRSRFIESASSDDGIGPTKFKAILLQEGLGNLKDAYFYTKESLKSAISVFEGKKIFADHPTQVEEQTRPERSVKDILGHFENVRYEESKDGTGQLAADVVILADKQYEWARGLMRHAVQFSSKFPDKDFVGLSINANGEAEPKEIGQFQKDYPVTESSSVKLQQALVDGLKEVKVVSSITEAISCDLVTEAGAGGKVTNILESTKKEKKKKGAADASKNKLSKGENKVMENKHEADAPEHKDEAQDVELIKQMLDEYLGKGDHAEETMSQAKEAYEAACGEGMSKEEAMKCAGAGLKMAAIMKKKSEAKAAEAAPEKKDEEKAPEKKDEEDKSKEAHQESEIIAVKAENAALKEKLAKIELDKYVDSKLAESKLTRENTKKFREACGDIKTQKDFDTKFKVWITAKEAAQGELDLSSWTMPEKQVVVERSEALNFSDCVKE